MILDLDKSLSNCPIYPLLPAYTKHLYTIYKLLDQRRTRRADGVEMLYNSFVFTGLCFISIGDDRKRVCWTRCTLYPLL